MKVGILGNNWAFLFLIFFKKILARHVFSDMILGEKSMSGRNIKGNQRDMSIFLIGFKGFNTEKESTNYLT